MPTREWISILLFFIVLHLGVSVYILWKHIRNRTSVTYCSISIGINIILFIVGVLAYQQAVRDEKELNNCTLI